MSDDFLVTVADARSAKMCMAGGRRVAAAHGFSWSQFVFPGIPASELARANDPLINRVIEEARKRMQRQ